MNVALCSPGTGRSGRLRCVLAKTLVLLALLVPTACSAGDQAQTAGDETTVSSTSLAPTSRAVPEPSDSEDSTAASSAASTSTARAFDGTVVEVDIAGGEVRTAEERVFVPLNSAVRLVVSSDAAGEVHIHGVDEYVQLRPGETVTHEFTATVPGTFEVEIHDAGLLFSLQVEP